MVSVPARQVVERSRRRLDRAGREHVKWNQVIDHLRRAWRIVAAVLQRTRKVDHAKEDKGKTYAGEQLLDPCAGTYVCEEG